MTTNTPLLIERYTGGTANCIHCKRTSGRHSREHKRTLIDLDGVIEVYYDKYHCKKCDKFFSTIPNDLIEPSMHYTARTVKAVQLMRQIFTIEKTREMLLKCCNGLDIPISTVHEMEKRGGFGKNSEKD